MTHCELWEDNAGGLHLFAYPSEGAPRVYATTYGTATAPRGYTPEEQAAADWVAIVEQCIDPWAEGWEGMDLEAARADWRECERWARQIADSSWTRFLLGVDADMCGRAGLDFAQELGVCKVCPKCGAVVSGTYISSAGAIRYPTWCPWCDADLD